jgi:CBS domain-containing protein
MLVKDAMTRRAETIGPDEPLQAAARKMKALGIGALPVCERDRLVGMITDRDIVVRGVADGQDPARAAVRSSMTPQVFYCFEDEPIHDAARLMEERSVRRLMVLDQAKRLVGILSADDLALVDRGLAAEVIERTREPERLVEGRPFQPPGGS